MGYTSEVNISNAVIMLSTSFKGKVVVLRTLGKQTTGIEQAVNKLTKCSRTHRYTHLKEKGKQTLLYRKKVKSSILKKELIQEWDVSSS